MYAATVVGTAGEANPLVRWALEQGLVTFVLLNLAAMLLGVGGFAALIRVFESRAGLTDRSVQLGMTGWLGLLIIAGLFVFVNNLIVILQGAALGG